LKGLQTMPNSRFARTYIDFSVEKSTIDFAIRDMTAGTIAALLTEAATLGSAIDDLSGGTLGKSQLIQDSANFNATPPTDPNAQRERKWLVRYRDITQFYDAPSTAFPNAGYGKTFTLEIPTADLSLLPAGHSDVIDADAAGLNAAITAYITAFEAFQKSPYNGDVELVELVAVGRNS